MKQAADLLRTLADEGRLRILNLLISEPEGVCVCELVDALRLPQYEVSRQLGVLRGCGLVTGVKRATWVYYRVSPDLPPLAASILKALRQQTEDETARQDQERLKLRLQLRAEGICTVGYPPGAPYREVIPIEEVASRGRR